MENVKDFFSNVSERLKNPLIFSFLCSWIVFNWPVTIALFWYGSESMDKIIHKDIFEYVKSYSAINSDSLFWYPLFTAIGYTVLMPIIKNGLKIFYAEVNKRGDDKELSIMKKGKVSMRKYLGIREDYEKRTAFLEKIIAAENTTLDELRQERDLRLEAEDESNKYKRKVLQLETKFSNVYDVNYFIGYWYLTFSYTKEESGSLISHSGKELMEITKGLDYYVLEQSGRHIVFKVTNYSFNPETRNVFFIKNKLGVARASIVAQTQEISEKYLINDLRFRDDNLAMSGQENGFIDVTYQKVPDISPLDNFETMIAKAKRAI